MSLDEKFFPIKIGFYKMVNSFFETIAQFFGYPENPGMPTVYEMPNKVYARSQFFNSLPKHTTYWPPLQFPETWFEMVFGPAPKVDAVPRYIYESKEEGFYNFYIENYRNIFFLPDWASEFIQVRLNICLDISLLETIREVLFVGLVIYTQMVILRIAIAWLIYINPYTFPWCYLVAAVDWTEDVLQGIVPSIFGVNATATLFLGGLGVVADSLNHLVFTMPFLPSEAEETKLLINREMKDVLVFHYLPVLWYKHPIPNNIREFWYYERPDILQYMQTAYKDLDIQLLPNSIIEQPYLNQQSDLVSQSSGMHDYLEYLSTETLFQSNDFVNYINLINDNFHNFVLNHINSLL
jgi:hypothetical protein